MLFLVPVNRSSVFVDIGS